jgi:transposase InsO family protein
MTSYPDRQAALQLLDEACAAGARQNSACREIGISVSSYRRWRCGGADRRPETPRPAPAHALSEAERTSVLEQCHRPEFASLPPAQIVPRLLDEQGLYLASESTFYRILRAAGEQKRRGRAAPPQRVGPPRRHEASAANTVWSWDVTYLATRVRGQFLYLYLIVDIYSRKITGFEVFESENATHSSRVIERAVWREGIAHRPLVLHGDNGSAMKGATLQARLEALGVTRSHSRPRVSNDNAFSEALFRTCKYRPGYPPNGFEDIDEARQWVLAFVRWYNETHRHSAIRYVTPEQRHAGRDGTILAERARLYQQAKQQRPSRWSGATRDWSPVGSVWLNPEPVLEAA